VGRPLPNRRALPQPTPETQPFWDAVKAHELHLQRCKTCERPYFPPRPFCPRPDCASGDVEWFKASGRASLFSYVIHHRSIPGFEAPYAIAVVELDEGPRLMTNIVGIEQTPEALVLDMPLQVDFDEVTEDVTVYQFKPVEA
jgi:hypothetical protein